MRTYVIIYNISLRFLFCPYINTVADIRKQKLKSFSFSQ